MGGLGRPLWQPGRPLRSPRVPTAGTSLRCSDPPWLQGTAERPGCRVRTPPPSSSRQRQGPDVFPEHGARAQATARSSLGAVQLGTRLRGRRCSPSASNTTRGSVCRSGHRTAGDIPLAKKVTLLSWILYWKVRLRPRWVGGDSVLHRTFSCATGEDERPRPAPAPCDLPAPPSLGPLRSLARVPCRFGSDSRARLFCYQRSQGASTMTVTPAPLGEGQSPGNCAQCPGPASCFSTVSTCHCTSPKRALTQAQEGSASQGDISRSVQPSEPGPSAHCAALDSTSPLSAPGQEQQQEAGLGWGWVKSRGEAWQPGTGLASLGPGPAPA